MTRGLRGVVVRRALLDPRRTGFYAIQMLWHKLLRRLMVFPLLALAASSLVLAGSGWLYGLAAAGQAAFYGLAIAGVATRGRPMPRVARKLVALPAYFCLVNLAALHAAWNVVRGHRIDRWEPQRMAAPEPPRDREPLTSLPAAATSSRWAHADVPRASLGRRPPGVPAGSTTP